MASSPTRHRVDVARLSNRCETGKACHADRESAWTAAEVQMDLGRVNPGCHLTPYECDECGLWHVRNRQIVPADSGNVARRPYGRRRQETAR